MINFPKYQPISTVVKAVRTNIKETQPGTDQLPTLGYIGFVEPQGSKAVIELDNLGTTIGTSTKVAQKWATANASSLSRMLTNLTTAHGDLPSNMTLTLVGYIESNEFTLVDAQLAANGNHSAYWLSISVLNELIADVVGVKSAFTGALYAEVDFNSPEQFIEAASQASGGTPMLWQCNPPSQWLAAPVLRDPFRIAA